MITYAMSSVGMCSRTLSAVRLGLIFAGGESPPEYLRLAAREGSRHEQWIKEDLPEHGFQSVRQDFYCKACDRYGIHVELVAGDTTKFKFIGHIDDYCYPTNNPGQMYIAEYKALGKYMVYSLKDIGIEGHRTYATQVSLYYYAQAKQSKLPILYVIKNRDTGFMGVKTYEEPIISLDKILSRLDVIEVHVAQSEMAPCDADRNGPDKYHCTPLCDEGAKLDAPAPESVTAQVDNYRTALSLEAEVKDLKDTARGIFSAYVQASGKKSISVDSMTLSWIPEGKRKVYQIPEEVKKAFETEAVRPGYLRVTDGKES